MFEHETIKANPLSFLFVISKVLYLVNYLTWESFKRHKLVIRFRCPGIDLYRLPEGYHKELDPFILDYLEVYRAGQVTDIDPPGAPLYIVIRPKNINFDINHS